MAPFSKPETVLKQAEGLVSVGQTHAALQSLTELFSSKRFRSAPLASLEPIMARFVELCVDLRKGRTAKDGLMQYKNIAQNSNVGSIELVISKFLALADAKVQQAQAQAAREVALIDVDDLEASETPESILLGAVSGDQSKDRTDRALVTPWLKFLWESYRTALETLKNNARLELIYQQTAQKAFQFCLKHQRKVEFRRLCETLRLHLQNVAKYAHQLHAVNLSDPDTLQRHLDTRFAQLHASIQLELWQEAFRSVEDVHNLLTMAKKAPRPSMMAGYYEQLAQVFLMSGNALYHAAAWAKYHQVVSSIGGKSAEDTEKLAGKVLIATLAVPVGQAADDESRSKSARLMSLLGLTKAPTRTTLLKDALSRHVLKLAPENIRALYSALEVTFDPLALPGAAAPLLAKLAEHSDGEYARYLPLVRKALLSRLLSQLAQVYSSITISSLLELLAPLRTGEVDAFDDAQVEAYIMGCARRGELHIRVDHAAGSINFSDNTFAESEVSAPGPSSASSSSKNSEQVQPSTSELVRTRLSRTATALHTALAKLHPAPVPTPSELAAQLQALVSAANAERESLRLRRALVARRRELLQELSARKEQEEASRRADAAKRRKIDDELRAADDARRKAKEHAQREMQTIRDNEVRVLAENLKARNILKVDLGDMKDVNTDMLMKLQVEQMEKEKRELADKTRTVAKRLDHLERALRKEERPLLAQDYAQQQASDKKTFEALQKARIEGARAEHAHNLETKARLARMTDDYAKHLETVSARRGEEFTKKREKAFRKMEEEKSKRREQVLAKRETDRLKFEEEERIRAEQDAEEERLAAEREAEEERLRAEAEAAEEAEAEKKRLEEESRAAARKQRELERQEAAESARRQQEREEEAERRRRERKAAPPAAAPAAAPTPIRASASAEPDAWRRAPRGGDGPARTESPRPGGGAPITASASAGGAYKPPFAAAGRGGGGGGWREREAARQAAAASGGTSSPRPSSPAPAAQASPAPATRKLPEQADDGFQTVEKKTQGVWRPSRGRGRGL